MICESNKLKIIHLEQGYLVFQVYFHVGVIDEQIIESRR